MASNPTACSINEEILLEKHSNDESNEREKTDGTGFETDTKVYKRRWIMLLVFCVYSFSNNYQWIHLNIIGNIVIRYYNESLPIDSFQQQTALDWLSMIYMLAYIPLIFPATWLLSKKGLKVNLICGSFLNALGAWLKCVCVSPDRFPVLMCAQTICAIAQIFILGIPAQLAAEWFGPDQISTATSIGVFANQVGSATGFFTSPLLVPNSDDLSAVGRNLSTMFYIGASCTTFIFFVIVIVFKEKPPVPPSRAQMLIHKSVKSRQYGTTLCGLFRNRGFMLLMIGYGINAGSYYGFATLMNPIILYYFPNGQQSAGQVGLTLVIAGVVGSIVGGIWLDRTRAYKSTTMAICVFATAGMFAMTFTINLGYIWVVFVTVGALGFFMNGYLPVGYQFAAEITYPQPEGMSSGLLNASAQLFGIVLTIVRRSLMNHVSVRSSNIIASSTLALGTLLTVFIKADYRRQAAGKETIDLLDTFINGVDVKIEPPEKDKLKDKFIIY